MTFHNMKRDSTVGARGKGLFGTLDFLSHFRGLHPSGPASTRAFWDLVRDSRPGGSEISHIRQGHTSACNRVLLNAIPCLLIDYWLI